MSKKSYKLDQEYLNKIQEKYSGNGRVPNKEIKPKTWYTLIAVFVLSIIGFVYSLSSLFGGGSPIGGIVYEIILGIVFWLSALGIFISTIGLILLTMIVLIRSIFNG